MCYDIGMIQLVVYIQGVPILYYRYGNTILVYVYLYCISDVMA